MVRPCGAGVGQQLLQDGDGAVVERGEGLVQQQQRRLVQEHAGHGEALAHAARELAHQAVADAVEADLAPAIRRRSGGGWLAHKAAEQPQVLERRQLIVDADAVAEHADPA